LDQITGTQNDEPIDALGLRILASLDSGSSTCSVAPRALGEAITVMGGVPRQVDDRGAASKMT
jgi:hypothetical protein